MDVSRETVQRPFAVNAMDNGHSVSAADRSPTLWSAPESNCDGPTTVCERNQSWEHPLLYLSFVDSKEFSDAVVGHAFAARLGCCESGTRVLLPGSRASRGR